MIRAAVLWLMLSVLPAAAEPDRLSLLLGSSHPGGQGYEDRTPGLFLTWEERGGLDLSLGIYRNSFGRAAVAATASLPVIRWTGGQAALFLGAALYPGDGHRFAAHAGDLVPLGGVQIRHGHHLLQIMPGDGMAVVTLGLSFPLQ